MSSTLLHGKGKNGLFNVGSTCYVNTSVQCLGHCLHFLKFILFDESNIIREGTLTYELKDVLKELWINDNGVIPNRFLKCLRVCMMNLMNVYEQNDMHEFITLFIDKMNAGISTRLDLDTLCVEYKQNSYDKLKKKLDKAWFMSVGREYSPMIDIFNGQSIVQIVCGHCNKIHHVYEPFSILTLPVPQQPSVLTDCLKHYATEEYLNEHQNDWKCDSCKKNVKSLKTMKFWRLPKVLMICLKRFTHDMKKNNVSIGLPDTIDVSEYMIGPSKETNYDLKAIGCHSGNFYSGHYFAVCRNPDGSWYRIDDTVISDANKDESRSNAYMLFYELGS